MLMEIEIDFGETFVPENELKRLLSKTKYIATLDEESGLKEMTLFVKEIYEIMLDVDNEINKNFQETAEERINEVKRDYYEMNLENRYSDNDSYFFEDSYDIILKNIDMIHYDFKDKLTKKEIGTLNELKDKIISKREDNKIKYLSIRLNKLLKERIHNITSIDRINNEIDEIRENYFSIYENLPKDLKDKINDCKLKGCYYRADKKLKEAQIAKASGNFKKEEKLIKEAEEMFKQDWEVIFPNKEKPALEFNGYKKNKRTNKDQ